MNKIIYTILSITLAILLTSCSVSNKTPLVLQSDFDLDDGAVASMIGVSLNVDKDLKVYNLTHNIPEYNIWEAGYRLYQTAKYWPKGTVFVSVVDPGVGTQRKSIVLKTENGYYFVSPDNGTLTLIAEKFGISEVREIDERVNRLKNSNDSYTFHGRDVYAYTGAKLASGTISYEKVGPKLTNQIVNIPYQKANILNDNTIVGIIPILDIQYGNVWTNIDQSLFNQLNPKIGDLFEVTIIYQNKLKFKEIVSYVNSFGAVSKGKPLLYLNSLLQVSLALNMDNFSEKYKINSGPDWEIEIKKLN
ncbi:hypothetical protein GKC56_07330 [Neisseriaceae bacterium PsAf]|nr:hypothetical protein [Neisseriaceae bacterium PsAf]